MLSKIIGFDGVSEVFIFSSGNDFLFVYKILQNIWKPLYLFKTFLSFLFLKFLIYPIEFGGLKSVVIC